MPQISEAEPANDFVRSAIAFWKHNPRRIRRLDRRVKRQADKEEFEEVFYLRISLRRLLPLTLRLRYRIELSKRKGRARENFVRVSVMGMVDYLETQTLEITRVYSFESHPFRLGLFFKIPPT